MSDFPPELAARLEGETTTLCHCWRLVRRDGQVLRFTDHDRAIAIGEEVFEPRTGFDRSAARESLGLSADAQDVEGALSSDSIAEADIAAGRYDGARVETLLVDWQLPEAHALIRTATIGRIERRDGRFLAQLESPAQQLSRVAGRIVRRTCDAILGDQRCGFDTGQTGFHGAGTVEAVEAADAIRVSGLDGFEEGWFAHGVVTWTGGANAGRAETVAAHRADAGAVVLTLWRPAEAMAPGDGFAIVAGCNKHFSTCRQRFGNGLNFRGFPHLPGNDVAYGYVNADQPLDGGPVVR